MTDKAKVHFYSKDNDETDLTTPGKLGADELTSKAWAPTFRGPAFKKLRAPTKTAITTKVDTQMLEQIRGFCNKRGITFASFVEVALAEELRKQLGNEGNR